MPNKKLNRYEQLIAQIFFDHYVDGMTEFDFKRDEFVSAANTLSIKLPKNLGDVVYAVRYRTKLPEAVREKAPDGLEWIIRPAGSGVYRFAAVTPVDLAPNSLLAETKIPDATPGIIVRYALGDEQALLARVRYNRLVDIFTGVTCYSLQNHLRSQVSEIGQVETDEIYVGVDRRGAQYVFPVQAKGGNDRLSVVQIEQDIALCKGKFPSLICRPIAAQFMTNSLIALFELEQAADNVAISMEKHYRLVPPEQISPDDLETYGKRSE